MKHQYLPLSLAQYNIYTQEAVAPDTDVNVLYFVLMIDRAVDPALLQRAADLFLARNDGPRTRITMQGGEPVQYVAPHRAGGVPFHDLSGLDRDGQAERFRAWGQAPFAFEDAPLCSLRVLRLAGERYGVFCKFHHIWCDGWATGLIWTEILNNYLSLERGEEPEGRAASFTDHLEADRAYRDSEQYAEDARFWRQYLDGVRLEDQYLPHARRRDMSADRAVFTLPEPLSDGVRRFARDNGLRPYLVFTAAMLVYHRRCQEDAEIVLGMPRMNRDTPDARRAVGMFVAELPMRLSPDPGTRFLDLCRQVEREAERMKAHKRYPLSAIVETVAKEQELQRGLIDCSVSYQKTVVGVDRDRLPAWVWFGNPAHLAGDLIWHVLDLFEGDPFTVFFDYRRVLYTRQSIEALQRSLAGILEAGIANPEQALSAFLPVSPVDRERLEAMGAGPRPSGWRETTPLRQWNRAVALWPEQTAVRGAQGGLTYRELDREADRAAAALLASGMRPDTIAAIMLPRDYRVLASAIGIWKAGGGFLWIDPSYPPDRIRYILRDSGAACVLTTAEMLDCLPPGEAQPLLYEELPEAGHQDREPGPEELSYCIYTSGTTGNPKGVLVEHRGLANLVEPASCPLVGAVAQAGGTVLAIGSFSFDISVLELFTTLLNGVAVAFAEEDDLESPARLAGRIRAMEVRVLFSTPSRLMAYLAYKEFRRALRGVEVLMSGGEAFPPGLYDLLREISPAMRIFNAYGPTEASIVTTVQEVSHGAPGLGAPVQNFDLFVLGGSLQLLPQGRAGELCVGGVGLARGYRNLPELTGEKFITWHGRRLYRTGDLVRYDGDGTLCYLGRIDNQVKLRGLRIELSEIEAVLAKVEGVTSCCCVVKERGGNELLCGFYTAAAEIDRRVLQEELSQRLPYYMVPSAFLRIPRVPTTINGKADLRALQEYELPLEAGYVPPANREEAILCRIMQKLLGRERVGAEDNFFEIGGNSLLAARFVVEAKAQGIELELGELFRKPTVRRLCAGQPGGDSAADLEEQVRDYDYRPLQELIRWDCETAPGQVPGEILLTGATGFLGLHILRELIRSTKSRIYCLVRPGDKLSAEERLRNLLFYYFEDDFPALFGDRLIPVAGDISQEGVGPGLPEALDLVINCAADVSHYAYGDRMRRVNLSGVCNLVTLCKQTGAGLVQISTPSVGQFGIDGRTERIAELTEEHLYFGQDLSNQYAATKFLAERAILEAAGEGLDARILRVGNLQARYADGEFQINHATNAFTSRIKTYIQMEAAPERVWEESVDYSPVDETARAIVTLLGIRSNNRVFHVFNNRKTPYSLIFEVLGEIGYPIRALSREAYQECVQRILRQPDQRELLSALIADSPGELDGHFGIGYTCGKTSALLAEYGFRWPGVSREYLANCLTNLEQLGAFDRL